jgi:hypothetical protein
VLDPPVVLDADWRRHTTHSGHWNASQEGV